MIYLQNIVGSQVMCVPKDGAVISSSTVPKDDLIFRARNTIDLAVEVNQVVADLQTSDLYYRVAISLPSGLPNGEYEYTLHAGKTLVSSGLLVIGENVKPIEYHNEITYEQYETE